MSVARDILVRVSESRKFLIEPGLSAGEVAAAEARFGVAFPPDLRELLMWGLPTGKSWPDWRSAIGGGETARSAAAYIEGRLLWPLDGMLFDIEHDSFWDPAWGARPAELEAAYQIARREVALAPQLVPIYGHRYLPTEPAEPGNPVLSVYQTDIIVYGASLDNYFEVEFAERDESHQLQQQAAEVAWEVRCWTRWMLAEWESLA